MKQIARIASLTIILIVLSAAYFFLVGGSVHNRYLEWLLTPIIHGSPEHLWGNIVAFALIGSLIELWLVPITRKHAVTFFAIAYIIDLLITLRRWIAMGEPSVGLSLMIFSFLGFSLYYYLRIVKEAPKIVPLTIGFLVGGWFLSFFANSIGYGVISAIQMDWQHGLAFSTAIVVSLFYFKEK